MHLTSLSPASVEVGWGSLGINGQLGYEGKSVAVRGTSYQYSLSSHPPARLVFKPARPYAAFRARVALNDDVPAGRSHADFFVYANGRQVACAPHVVAGEEPRLIEAEIAGVENLELHVRTTRWEYCHAVWLDPELLESPPTLVRSPIVDCLGRAEIEPATLPSASCCVATVASPGFERQLESLLGSLRANGGVDDALIVVFVIDPNGGCEQVAARYGAAVVPCRRRAWLSAMSKALLYSIGNIVDAERFVLVDADMMVIGDLRPLFAAIGACAESSILACREGNGNGFTDLNHALLTVYGGNPRDHGYLGISPQEAAYPFVVNDGLFAASRSALIALDGCVRGIQNAAAWSDGNRRYFWRNQFIFNLALARMRCGVELDPGYNLQLNSQDAALSVQGSRIHASWHGRGVRVLHFNGVAKNKYLEIQSMYNGEGQPVGGPSPGDLYAQFLDAFKCWAGQFGNAALAWSFYGTADAQSARVTDRTMFPLLATLHYLVRSNGCVRVLETGTARGVSAACLASAVAHQPGARVVTMDPADHPQRHKLWETLPERMRACIDERSTGSIEGMTAALDAGETYHAVLLDSIHKEEHVWAEFQLATRLVCEGGLILIHDAEIVDGPSGALDRIAAAGYGVVRLWTAKDGVAQDDHLGIAVIENRIHEPRPPDA